MIVGMFPFASVVTAGEGLLVLERERKLRGRLVNGPLLVKEVLLDRVGWGVSSSSSGSLAMIRRRGDVVVGMRFCGELAAVGVGGGATTPCWAAGAEVEETSEAAGKRPVPAAALCLAASSNTLKPGPNLLTSDAAAGAVVRAGASAAR